MLDTLISSWLLAVGSCQGKHLAICRPFESQKGKLIVFQLCQCPTMGPPPALGQSLVTSSSGMPGESRSLGQAPLGIRCHAAAGIPEQRSKSTSSSRGDWLRASRRSAAPSTPLLRSLKHLQCLCQNHFLKTIWTNDNKYTKYR